MTPIYLFSLPRSGSTLVQRVIAAHHDVCTVSEPWVLLPLLYALKERGVYAEYNHRLTTAAVKDFCAQLPQGRADYLSELRSFVLALYEKATNGAGNYFLDKTPRYHLIVQEILDLFPDGKYIFLWRNPLAVVASIIETWGHGNWNLFVWKVDVFDGVENLVDAFRRNSERVCAVRYEDLVNDTTGNSWKGVFDYLGLSFDSKLLADFGDTKLAGRMGDETGTRQFGTVSSEPVDKWKRVLANPARKVWCRRYLRWLGRDRLAIMGYELDELLEELDALPTSMGRTVSDVARMGLGLGYCCLEPYLLREKLMLLPRWRRVHVHR